MLGEDLAVDVNNEYVAWKALSERSARVFSK